MQEDTISIESVSAVAIDLVGEAVLRQNLGGIDLATIWLSSS